MDLIMTAEELALTAKRYLERQKIPNERAEASNEPGYEVLFDSLAEGASTGLRNSVVAARQLLFRIGTIFIDLEVGRETDSKSAFLIGQMLDSSKPGHPPAGVPVELLDHGRRVAMTSSNDYGEFQLQFAVKDNLKLSVELDRNDPVHLPITSPPGSKGNAGDVKQYHPLGNIVNRTIE
jgi:hypothetical protein